MTLTIVGLGPGDIDDLTRKAWRVLSEAETVYLRTAQHPCVPNLPQDSVTYHSFDPVYESVDDFDAVYATIVERLLEAARQGDVVYAVPGDPLVGALLRGGVAGHRPRPVVAAGIFRGGPAGECIDPQDVVLVGAEDLCRHIVSVRCSLGVAHLQVLLIVLRICHYAKSRPFRDLKIGGDPLE